MSRKRTIWRAALFGGGAGAGVGVICGVLYSVGGFFVDLFTSGLNWGTLMAFGALIGMPAVFGGIGFGVGALIGIVRVGLGRID